MNNKVKKKAWISARHQVVRDVVCLFLEPYSKIKYGIKIEKFKQENKRNYLVLYNHQTPFDQFFVGMAFKKHLYYVATEDIFSNGWVSKLIKYLVNPIPIKKQTTDVRAILNCIKVAKEGGSIAIAPEGNRTYSGKTEYINPSIVALARKLGLPVLFYRIEGGYGAEPRWSDVVRKGKMRGYVSRVLETSEYEKMTDDELLSVICTELMVDESRSNMDHKHKKKAEYLERAIYVCKTCGLSIFESEGNFIKCTRCGSEAEYLSNNQIRAVKGDIPFSSVNEWYEYQKQYVNSLDVAALTSDPIYHESTALRKVIPYKEKILLEKRAMVSLYGDRLELQGFDIGKKELLFKDISSVAVLGRNKLNIYYGDDIYQFKSDKRFNALKYVNIYFRYQNQMKGDRTKDGEFLGI